MYRHILLPTDGSALATEGVEQGLELAKALSAEVTVLAVSESFRGIPLAGEPQPTAQMDNAEVRQAANLAASKILGSVADRAKLKGVKCEGIHVHDRYPPSQAILDTAANRGCDLIVMSSHGLRGVRRMLLGSQASDVVARSPIPVLIVRRS